MPRTVPISLNVMPDVDLEAENTAHVVIHAYTAAMTYGRNEERAFDAAVKAWRERNPQAPPDSAATAVAQILCHTK